MIFYVLDACKISFMLKFVVKFILVLNLLDEGVLRSGALVTNSSPSVFRVLPGVSSGAVRDRVGWR